MLLSHPFTGQNGMSSDILFDPVYFFAKKQHQSFLTDAVLHKNVLNIMDFV